MEFGVAISWKVRHATPSNRGRIGYGGAKLSANRRSHGRHGARNEQRTLWSMTSAPAGVSQRMLCNAFRAVYANVSDTTCSQRVAAEIPATLANAMPHTSPTCSVAGAAAFPMPRMSRAAIDAECFEAAIQRRIEVPTAAHSSGSEPHASGSEPHDSTRRSKRHRIVAVSQSLRVWPPSRRCSSRWLPSRLCQQRPPRSEWNCNAGARRNP